MCIPDRSYYIFRANLMCIPNRSIYSEANLMCIPKIELAYNLGRTLLPWHRKILSLGSLREQRRGAKEGQ